jgi:predicted phage terminase large subunit-like protein
MMDIWQQELRPALADRKGGAMFISTPKGYNGFYDLWRMAETDPDWHSWQVPSWENPYLEPAEIEAAKKSLPDLVFRQEFGAEFVQLAGAMFRREYFHMVDRAEVPEIKNVVRFWDLAASTKTMADFSVGAKVGMDDNGDIWILNVTRGRFEWPELLRRFKAIATDDGGSVLQGVETAGTQKGFLDLLLAEPVLAGLSIQGYTPEKDKITRAQPFLARAEQGKVRVVRADWTSAFIDEHCGFPEVEHDDQVDAISGAMVMLVNSKIPNLRFL